VWWNSKNWIVFFYLHISRKNNWVIYKENILISPFHELKKKNENQRNSTLKRGERDFDWRHFLCVFVFLICNLKLNKFWCSYRFIILVNILSFDYEFLLQNQTVHNPTKKRLKPDNNLCTVIINDSCFFIWTSWISLWVNDSLISNFS
jgi:hypothetical protein